MLRSTDVDLHCYPGPFWGVHLPGAEDGPACRDGQEQTSGDNRQGLRGAQPVLDVEHRSRGPLLASEGDVTLVIEPRGDTAQRGATALTSACVESIS